MGCCNKIKGQIYPTLEKVEDEQLYLDCFSHFESISKQSKTTQGGALRMVDLYNKLYEDNKSPHSRRHLDYVYATLGRELGNYINAGRQLPKKYGEVEIFSEEISEEEVDNYVESLPIENKEEEKNEIYKEHEELFIDIKQEEYSYCSDYNTLVKQIKLKEKLTHAEAVKKASKLWKKIK